MNVCTKLVHDKMVLTRLAPMLLSTAPSISHMASYFLVMEVLLKPGCNMKTEIP